MSGAATNALRTHFGQKTLVGSHPDFGFPVYLALFTTDPGDAGDTSGEVTAAEYARQLIGFATPGVGVFTWVTNIDVLFAIALGSWGTAQWGGIMDGTGPTASMMYHGLMTGSMSVPTGYQVKLIAGAGGVTFP
jgi:hypothetical protein